MRRHLSTLFAASFALVALVSAAAAQPHIGISGFTGYQSYSMSQINDAIDEVSNALSSPGDQANIDNLSGDFAFGGAVKADFNPNWRAYLEYEHLKDSVGYGNTIGQFQIEPSAEAIMIGGTYFFPSENKMRLGLGAGIGYYAFGGSVNSSVTWNQSTTTGSHDLGGSTVGFHGRGELEVTVSPVWRFDAALGYRSAKGALETDSTDASVDLDWSGLMTRIGVTYFVN